MFDEVFDVIVVGGGHAGTEAAAVCARMGARTLLVTQDPSRIGILSCNPSIGGIGKSHLVREVDALDGLMGRAADRACIHNKTLNRSKGPAVRGVRVQADRSRYRAEILYFLSATPGLTVRAGEAQALILSEGFHKVAGLHVDGKAIGCRALVIATGTFLRGVTHVGHQQTPEGRRGDAPSVSLAECLERLHVPLGRLKTGTPPRLVRETIAWESLPADWGDAQPSFLSFDSSGLTLNQVECRITHTTAATHALVSDNLAKSALYGGHITAVGPRYCPSIEDKIVRFAGRDRHQVFLEPEGLPGTRDGQTIYPNGISTSLPADVQIELVRSMAGCAAAEVSSAGYAVEYDFVRPDALDHSLQVKGMPGLFLAGQITGTTGYEEAAALGIYAGINAAQHALGRPPFVLDRATSYIGVMVDDLVAQSLTEPYRMFTSRAEYRLQLRCDNADLRLTPLGIDLGCVTSVRAAAFSQFQSRVQEAFGHAYGDAKTPSELAAFGVVVKQDGESRTLLDVADSEVPSAALLAAFPWAQSLQPRVLEQVATSGLYAGYIRKQAVEAAHMRARASRPHAG